MFVAVSLLFGIASVAYLIAVVHIVAAVRSRGDRREPPTVHRRSAGSVRGVPDLSTLLGSDAAAAPHRTAIGHVYGVRECRAGRARSLLERIVRAVGRSVGLAPGPSPGVRVQGLWGQTWDAPRKRATCTRTGDGEGVPHPSPCRCGINMYDLGADRLRELIDERDRSTLLALTRGWGERVVVHEDGYRVQHAEILALLVPPWLSKRAGGGQGLAGDGWEGVLVTAEVDEFAREVDRCRQERLIAIPDREA